MAKQRKVVAVRRKGVTTIGTLYFKTPTHVVLLNHVVKDADLGRLRLLRDRHFEPEADVIVIPRDDIVSIENIGMA